MGVGLGVEVGGTGVSVEAGVGVGAVKLEVFEEASTTGWLSSFRTSNES
jgi:hypothetical protein